MRTGSAALTGYVAAGRVDAYFEAACRQDVFAGALLVRGPVADLHFKARRPRPAYRQRRRR